MNARVRAVALGNDPADVLLRNGRVIDVLTEIVYKIKFRNNLVKYTEGNYAQACLKTNCLSQFAGK